MSAPRRDAATRDRRRPPSAARPRRRPTRRRARRRAGSACGSSTPADAPASASAPATRFDVVDRNAVGERAVDREPVAGGSIVSDVGELEADHLGVDQVVAVVAHAGDPQRQRQLRRRDHRSGIVTPSAPRVQPIGGASAPHSSTSSSSGRACGSIAGAPRTSRASTTLGERPAQHLAPLPERGADEREQRLGSMSTAGAVGGRSRRAPTRRSVAARTPSAGTTPAIRAVAQYATFTLTAPYASIRGRRATAARPPRAAPSPASARSPGRRRAGRTRAAWRRCTAGWRRASSCRAPRSSASQSSVIASASTTVDVRARRRRRRAAPGRCRGRPRPRARRRRSRPARASATRGRRRSRRPRSPGPTSARRAIRRTVFGSPTKFWPRSRAGRRCRQPVEQVRGIAPARVRSHQLSGRAPARRRGRRSRRTVGVEHDVGAGRARRDACRAGGRPAVVDVGHRDRHAGGERV